MAPRAVSVSLAARPHVTAQGSDIQGLTFLFSGYARLPNDVSHQALYKRVGVVVEVDQDGAIVGCTSSLMMDLARDFFGRLLAGRSVLSERAEIEAEIRFRYRGHSQAALISAMHKVFEAVDQSPLVLGTAAAPLPSAKRPDAGTETYG